MSEREQIEQGLDGLRRKLLDLSTRNQMLNFSHPHASCLRVVDELAHQMFDLLREGATLTFEPVPEPTTQEAERYSAHRSDPVPRASEAKTNTRPDAATWARHLGINVSYDLPVETDSFQRPTRYADRNIQTLHYFDELDARLRKIRNAGKLAIEESGANMLYLAFGFLEWRDVATSRAHQAPLVLLPVRLDNETPRGARPRFRVKWTGEEHQTNLSLKKKLEDFGVDLPDLLDGQSLEPYLTEVSRATRHMAGWTVRRYVTLGLFEFGKILLYLDLDPERWPTESPLSEAPLVRALLGAPEAGEGDASFGQGAEAPASEEIAKSRDLDLEVVDRADSSQCQALEAALSGRNVVIQGPPGTGKSQTITNLIAAALSRGKTVLFVAEKMAALEVVQRRMRELGLGDFCLELHSHKTRKTEVLGDIAARIKAGDKIRAPRNYAAALSRLAERRRQLAAYIETVSRAAAGFADLTIGEALMKAGQARRNLRDHLKVVEGFRRDFAKPHDLSWSKMAEAKSRLDQLVLSLSKVANATPALNHAWAGVSSTSILPQDAEQLVGLAEAWAAAIKALVERLDDPRLQRLPLRDLASAQDELARIDRRRVDLLRADEAIAAVERLLGLTLPCSTHGLAELLRLIAAANAAPMADLDRRNPQLIAPGASSWLRDRQERLDIFRAEDLALSSVLRDAARDADVDDLEEWSAALVPKNPFARLGQRYRTALQSAESLFRPAHRSDRPSVKAAYLARLRRSVLDQRKLESAQAEAHLVGASPDLRTVLLAPHLRVADWADATRSDLPTEAAELLIRASAETLSRLAALCADQLQHRLGRLQDLAAADVPSSSFWQLGVYAQASPPVASLAQNALTDAQWTDLLGIVQLCSPAAQAAAEAEHAFVSATKLDKTLWFGESGRPELTGVGQRARFAASNAPTLEDWLEFDRAFQLSATAIEASVARAAAKGVLASSAMGVALDYLVFDGIAREAFAADSSVLAISGFSLDALRSEYASIDAEVMELHRADIAARLAKKRAPEGRSTGKVADLTEMALVRAEIVKQKKHIPVRQLIKRSGCAIQALKPCFMMGPLSVAQYLAPGALKFDLVIMDEASQMTPEDAIGAMARGGQAVIVGDSEQLPRPRSSTGSSAPSPMNRTATELRLPKKSKVYSTCRKRSSHNRCFAGTIARATRA